MIKCCIICFRKLGEDPSVLFSKKENENNGILLKRFFRLLGRYLKETTENESRGRRKAGEFFQFEPVKKLLKKEIFSSCKECVKIIGEFCGLYSAMKSMELHIHWKLWTIGRIMKCAEMVPSRMKGFQESVEQLTILECEDTQEIIKSIFEFKKDLGRQFTQKLLGTCPKLTLYRCNNPVNEVQHSTPPDTGDGDNSRTLTGNPELDYFEEKNSKELIQTRSAGNSATEKQDPLHQQPSSSSTIKKSPLKRKRTKSGKLPLRKRLFVGGLIKASSKVKARYKPVKGDRGNQNVKSTECCPVLQQSKIKDPTKDESTEETTNARQSESLLGDTDNDNLIEVYESGIDVIYGMTNIVKISHEDEGVTDSAFTDDIGESEINTLNDFSNCNDNNNHSTNTEINTEAEIPPLQNEQANSEKEKEVVGTALIESFVASTDTINIEPEVDVRIENESNPTSSVPTSPMHPDDSSFHQSITFSVADIDKNPRNLLNSATKMLQETCVSVSEPLVISEEKKLIVDNLVSCIQTTDSAPTDKVVKLEMDEYSVPQNNLGSSVRPSRLRQVHHCPKCNKTCSSQMSLQTHLKSHETEAPAKSSTSQSEIDEDLLECGPSSTSTDSDSSIGDHLREDKRRNKGSPSQCKSYPKSILAIQKAVGYNPGGELRSKSKFSTDSEDSSEDDEDDSASLDKEELMSYQHKPKHPFESKPVADSIVAIQKAIGYNPNYTKQLGKNKLFRCNTKPCSKIFYNSEDHKSHKKAHGKFPCLFCESVLEYAPDLAMHELTHRSDYTEKDRIDRKRNHMAYKCPRPDCIYSATTKLVYINHFLTVHMQLGGCGICNSCEICGAIFTAHRLKRQLKAHYDLYHNFSRVPLQEPIKCDEDGCSAYFLEDVQLVKHKTIFHGGFKQKVHKCKDCVKRYRSVKYLKKHRIIHHFTEADFKFQCPKESCGKRFETKVCLEGHLRCSHSDKLQDFHCPKCNKSFKGNVSFKNHMKSHDHSLQETEVVCEKCGKIFRGNNGRFRLDLHYLSHSGPDTWEYKCSVCSKKCMTQQKLEEHRRTHTKEKPFVCQVCGEKYAHRHNLRIHVNNKHSDVMTDSPRKYHASQLKSRKGVKRKKMEDESPPVTSVSK